MNSEEILNELLRAIYFYNRNNIFLSFPVIAKAHASLNYRQITIYFVKLLNDKYVEQIISENPDVTDKIIITQSGIRFILDGGYKMEDLVLFQTMTISGKDG